MCTVKAALLSALALASAEILLAPEDIPIECAPICGPVVELTDKCSLGVPAAVSSKSEDANIARMKRRRVESRNPSRGSSHTRLHDKKDRRKRAVVTNAFGQVVSVPSGLESGRTFTVTAVVTVTAAPSPPSAPNEQGVTAPPADAASSTWTVMTTVMTMVAPGDDLELPTSDDSATPTSTPIVVGNVAEGDDTTYSYAETEDVGDTVEDAERECVCQNDSFDVEAISGLCASCITQSGFSIGSKYRCIKLHRRTWKQS